MVGDPQVRDEGDRKMDVDEPGEGEFPPACSQVSQRDVERKRSAPDDPHESKRVAVQVNGFPPVGSSQDYNGIPAGMIEGMDITRFRAVRRMPGCGRIRPPSRGTPMDIRVPVSMSP